MNCIDNNGYLFSAETAETVPDQEAARISRLFLFSEPAA
jgi:hypothetical protein